MSTANPAVCLSCEFKKYVKSGIASHVYCAKNENTDEHDTEANPLSLLMLDQSRFIGIAHKINGEEGVTLNPDFQIPSNCAYTFEHLLAGDQGIKGVE